ncbi:hypothetical protein INT43_000994 [Umbelopsis isabellina]|uniref:Uncharacterized protein n=1 Tax=Mortierella isabellina TaxID=91625 RepID=A0A8H7Q3D6_MORIS|nr:hypothetical protein INT43_000994 [Umbelopsis isabellina]
MSIVKRTLDVLVPQGFDLNAIEKYMMDYYSNFIRYEDEEAINSRKGSSFIVLQQTHFIAHAANRQVNCDYDCRNVVMRQLYEEDHQCGNIINNFFLQIQQGDGLLHNRELPYLLFTNECVRDCNTQDNSIIACYDKVEFSSFADITKSKPCNHNFFVVYLGNDQYVCCDVLNLDTYEYTSSMRYRVMEILQDKTKDAFTELKSQDEELKLLKPVERLPEFQLVDIEGYPVEANTEYHLEMYDYDEDVLNLHDDKLYATYCYNSVDKIVVQCSMVDGIYILACKNKYLHVADCSDDIRLTARIPERHQRLQFQVTENNTFKVFRWGQRYYLIPMMVTSNYTSLYFVAMDSSSETEPPVEFFLKRC